MVIHIQESQKAHLPEMHIYPEVLRDLYEYTVETINHPIQPSDLGVYWKFMGQQRKRPPGYQYLIHDYRSLSTGFFASAKDSIKRLTNVKPDLRIFLNEEIRDIMRFNDSIPHIILDMGVPEWINDYRGDHEHFDYKFAYVGAISRERKMDKLLDAFLDSEYRDERFLLIGKAEAKLVEQYKMCGNIVFAGSLPQKEVFKKLGEAEYAVCYFPNHRPHCFQTPTKLLEYASLGKKIIANPSVSNMRVSEQYTIHVAWGGAFVFDGLKDVSDSQDNRGFDFSRITWKERFRKSGFIDILKQFEQMAL